MTGRSFSLDGIFKMHQTYPIDIKQRKFPTRMVRDCCSVIYGKPISRDAWTQWRRWSGVQARSRYLSFEQFCYLAAIAWIRGHQLQHGNPRTELRRTEIDVIANGVELQSEIKRLLDIVDVDRCIGRDAPLALAARGLDVSLRSLYRNVPGFNTQTVYKLDYLEELAVA